MKPSFSVLWANYPHADRSTRKQLFDAIGWGSIANEPAYQNTCAIRVSVGLQRSGMEVDSSAGMRALAGAIKGKNIEIRHEKLSDYLKTKWGTPETLVGTPAQMEAAIGDRNGVISFFEIPGYEVGGGLGGHIDVIDGKDKLPIRLFGYGFDVNRDSVCGSHCYWNAARAWFWELH